MWPAHQIYLQIVHMLKKYSLNRYQFQCVRDLLKMHDNANFGTNLNNDRLLHDSVT